MPSALYDEVFSVPVAYRRLRQVGLDRGADELEFSEYGRSPSVPAGWYLLPGLLITATLMALL